MNNKALIYALLSELDDRKNILENQIRDTKKNTRQLWPYMVLIGLAAVNFFVPAIFDNADPMTSFGSAMLCLGVGATAIYYANKNNKDMESFRWFYEREIKRIEYIKEEIKKDEENFDLNIFRRGL